VLIRQRQTPKASERLISVIIPCYNEAGNIEECLNAVIATLDTDARFELIPVNDGSRDATWDILQRVSTRQPAVRPLDLLRNYGQTAAYAAGIEAANGTHILFFSADLEIPPEQIIEVISQLDAGYDFVNTSRKDRWGGTHAIKSKLANRLLNRLCNIEIHDRGSGLKGMTRTLAEALCLYGEWHRFLPDLASIETSRIIEFEVPYTERKSGVSSYRGKLKSLTVFLDLLTVAFTIHARRKPFMMLPGRLFGFTGLLVGSTGLVISCWLVYLKLFFGERLSDRPLFMVSIILVVVGLNMVITGVLGELMMQVHTRLGQLITPGNLPQGKENASRDRAGGHPPGD